MNALLPSVRTRLPWRSPAGTPPAIRRITAAVVRMVAGDLAEARGGDPGLVAGGDMDADTEPGSLIWGGGLAEPAAAPPRLRADRFLAVRGMMTADCLVASGIRLRDIPIGDVGLLASRLARPPDRRPAVPLAVVPALASRREPFFAGLARTREVCVVDLGEDSLEPLWQIAGADVVVAEDLHGLVYAEAFAKPSVWVASRSDDRHDFRFRDWFSTVFEKRHRPLAIGGSVVDLAAAARRAHAMSPVEELAEALRRSGIGPG